MPSFFDAVDLFPLDPVLGLPILFQEDPRPRKVNLGIGSYKTAEGASFLLNAVRKAEEKLAALSKPKDYLPLEGDPRFIEKVIELNLGQEIDRESVFAIQSIGGTGALKLAAEFIHRSVSSIIAVPAPTWPNHHLVFKGAGLHLHEYPYYDYASHKLTFDLMLASIEALPPGSVVLLHAACHNPSGADLSQDQWKALLEVIQRGRLLPLFDNAYQGFGISLEEDVFPIRKAAQMGIEMLIAASFSKNFGLYGERVGALIFSMHHKASVVPVRSELRQIARSIYSTPPSQGAWIVGEILSDPHLKKEWEEDLNNMRTRLLEMRENLAAGLNSRRGDGVYQFLEHQKGFFSILGLTEEKVLSLRKDHGIYVLNNGRINIAGLTPDNLPLVIEALA